MYAYNYFTAKYENQKGASLVYRTNTFNPRSWPPCELILYELKRTGTSIWPVAGSD